MKPNNSLQQSSMRKSADMQNGPITPPNYPKRMKKSKGIQMEAYAFRININSTYLYQTQQIHKNLKVE